MTLRSISPQITLVLSLSALLFGCAGAQPKQIGDENSWESTPKKSSESSSDSSSSSSSSPVEEPTKWTGAAEPIKLNEDQEKQISIALSRGEKKAANCSQVVDDATTGEGAVNVKFDGKIGKAVDAEVLAPFAGTNVEKCIQRAFIGEYCLPFEGDPIIRKHAIKLPAKK